MPKGYKAVVTREEVNVMDQRIDFRWDGSLTGEVTEMRRKEFVLVDTHPEHGKGSVVSKVRDLSPHLHAVALRKPIGKVSYSEEDDTL